MNSHSKRFPLHIGMRTFKTAIAVGLSILVGYLIHSTYPPFLAVGALGTMESSISASIRGVRNLAVGNLIGALLSMAFYIVFDGHPAIACFLGVLIMIILCNAMHMKPNTTNLACVVFCCTLIDMTTNGVFLHGLFRLRDTVIGSLIALSVNMLIRPYSGAERTKKDILTAQKVMLPLMDQRVLRGRLPDLREMRRDINIMNRDIDIMLDEKFNFSLKKGQVAHLRGCQQLVWKMRDSLIGICCIDSTPTPSAENLARLESLGFHPSAPQETILNGMCDEEDQVVFNYYLRIFLDANDYLTQLIDI